MHIALHHRLHSPMVEDRCAPRRARYLQTSLGEVLLPWRQCPDRPSHALSAPSSVASRPGMFAASHRQPN